MQIVAVRKTARETALWAVPVLQRITACCAAPGTRRTIRAARRSFRQRDELGVVAGHGVEAGELPVGLGLIDALLARGDEIPPDVARTVHGGAAEQHQV